MLMPTVLAAWNVPLNATRSGVATQPFVGLLPSSALLVVLVLPLLGQI